MMARPRDMLLAYLNAAANNTGAAEALDQVLDMLGSGIATATVLRARDGDLIALPACHLFAFRGDAFPPATLAIARAALETIGQRFGSDLVVLIAPIPEAQGSRPFAVRIVDGAGCVFVARGETDVAILRHEMAHIACASGHPLLDEGLATWAEDPAAAAAAGGHAPFDFDTACHAAATDDTLAQLPLDRQAAFRAAAGRLAAWRIARATSLEEVVTFARHLRGTPPGDALRHALRGWLGEGLDAVWNAETIGTGESLDASLAFLRHDANATSDGRTDYVRFLASTVALFNFPPFWADGAELIRRHREWSEACAPVISWSGAPAALARFYRALETAIMRGDSGDAATCWWDVSDAFDAMLADHGDVPEVAAAAAIYIARQPEVDDEDRDRAAAILLPHVSHPRLGAAVADLAARLALDLGAGHHAVH